MMLPLPVVQSPRLRQSTIYDYRSCPRKFLLRHRCNLELKGKGSKRSLDVGTFFHELMASLYKTDEKLMGQLTIDQLIEERVLAAAESIESPELVRQELNSRQALAEVMVDIYWDMFPLDRSKFRLLEAEEVVRNEWAEGIPDAVLEDTRNGNLWLVDHKTEGRDGMIRSAPLTFELQPRLYRMLLQEKLGRPIVGVLHNIIVKCPLEFGQNDRPFTEYDHVLTRGPRKGQTIRKKEYTSEEPEYELYLNRVRDWYLAEGEYELERDKREANPMLLQSWTRFAGNPYIDEELGVEIEQVRRAAGHMSSCPMVGDPAVHEDWAMDYPRHDGSCRAYNSLCEFIGLCTSDPATWPERVSQDFQLREQDSRYAEVPVEAK